MVFKWTYTVITNHKSNENGSAYKKYSHALLRKHLPGDTQKIIFNIEKINDSTVTGVCELALSIEDMKEIIDSVGSVGIKIKNGVPSISTYY